MTKRFLSYGAQSIGSDDARAVTRVLFSSHLTQGPEVPRFEEAFAKAVDAPFAVAVSSGTAALHLACLAAGFKRGEEALTSPVTFVATPNSVLYTGASVSFVDVDADGNLDLSLKPKPIPEKARGILPVHLAGLPCRWGQKKDWSTQKEFVVIEDACHALGAEERRGRTWTKIGSCAESDMAVFSFHPVKHIATGEGGMITTRSRALYEKLSRLRTHGIEKDPKNFKHAGSGSEPWYYEMQELGFNYRMTDIQAALGLSQLKKLPAFVRRRRDIAAQYRKLFKNCSWIATTGESEDRRSSWHLFIARIDFREIDLPRAAVMLRLREAGIGTQVHYIPVYRQPYYEAKYGTQAKRFPGAERFYTAALSLPMHPKLTDADVRRVAQAVLAFGGER